jgi:hypothetical protein
MLEEFELCVEDHVLHRMPGAWRSFQRQYQLLALEETAALREARELTIKCLTFKLAFESTATFTLPGGGWTSTVSSEMTLRYDPDEDRISGEAPMVVEDFRYVAPPHCTATNYRNEGGTFKVFNMAILIDKPDALGGGGWVDVTGWEVNLLLAYFPGLSSASYDLVCQGGTVSVPASAAWTSGFVATHQAEFATRSHEMPSDAGYLSLDWEVFGNEYFAKKEWIKESSTHVDAGAFKLYHTPGA